MFPQPQHWMTPPFTASHPVSPPPLFLYKVHSLLHPSSFLPCWSGWCGQFNLEWKCMCMRQRKRVLSLVIVFEGLARCVPPFAAQYPVCWLCLLISITNVPDDGWSDVVLLSGMIYMCTYIRYVHSWHASMDVHWLTSQRVGVSVSAALTFNSLFSANHRRAGHAVTNILAKELMQEDVPLSSKLPAKKSKLEEEEPNAEGAESLEELLETAASRSH